MGFKHLQPDDFILPMDYLFDYIIIDQWYKWLALRCSWIKIDFFINHGKIFHDTLYSCLPLLFTSKIRDTCILKKQQMQLCNQIILHHVWKIEKIWWNFYYNLIMWCVQQYLKWLILSFYIRPIIINVMLVQH